MAADQFRFITIQQLEAFVSLVEERSFSNAAKKMLLSQPSLSKHIRNLEIFTDCRLINRSKEGISLTSEGTVLLAYARKMLKLRDEAREKILILKDTVSGHIHIGTSTIPSTYILPAVLTGLRDSHPDIHVHILSGDSEDVLEMVINSQVEIGFIGRQAHDARLVCEPVWEDELVLVAAKGHHFEDRASVKVQDIIAEPFIIREKGSGTRAILEEYLKDNSLPPISKFSIACELGSSEAIKEAAISGLGISIISIHAVRREIEHGLLVKIPIEGPAIRRSFFMIHRKQLALLPHQRTFMEFARAYAVGA